MKMNQVYDILNTVTQEILGDSVVVAEDLSNIVDVGKAYENLENGLDNYVRKLHDHIGRVDKIDTLRRRTKRLSGEEQRRRQYDGTAMEL